MYKIIKVIFAKNSFPTKYIYIGASVVMAVVLQNGHRVMSSNPPRQG